MSAPASLRELVLGEGLEDLIPLPEIAATARVQGAAAPESMVHKLTEVLVELLNEGRIQIWSGHWSTDPQPVDTASAEHLLRVEEQYRFNSPADLRLRVYYVNVENLRV